MSSAKRRTIENRRPDISAQIASWARRRGTETGPSTSDFARQHRPDLRILFVTGYAEQVSDGDDFLEPGMFPVTKPFNLDALAFKIREIFSSAR